MYNIIRQCRIRIIAALVLPGVYTAPAVEIGRFNGEHQRRETVGRARELHHRGRATSGGRTARGRRAIGEDAIRGYSVYSSAPRYTALGVLMDPSMPVCMYV